MLLGKLYTAWSATMTSSCILFLLGTTGLRLDSLNSMISLPVIPPLFPPPGFETRKSVALGVTFTLLSTVPASFSSAILTGSISWHASTQSIPNAGLVQKIGTLKAPNFDWCYWCQFPSFREYFAHRGNGITIETWRRPTGTSSLIPSSRRMLLSIEDIPVGYFLDNVTVPWFRVESITWITDLTDVSPAQFRYLTGDASAGAIGGVNPPIGDYSLAILPDVPFRLYRPYPESTLCRVPKPAKLESKTGIVALNVGLDLCLNHSTIFGQLPQNVAKVSPRNSKQPELFTCYVFARIKYSAGVATCRECPIISPFTVESPPTPELTLEADVMTRDAMYLMADVIGLLAKANITLPPTWNNVEGYMEEMLVRGYSGAWNALTEIAGRNGPYLSTGVSIRIPISIAVVNRGRVWVWASLQVVAFSTLR